MAKSHFGTIQLRVFGPAEILGDLGNVSVAWVVWEQMACRKKVCLPWLEFCFVFRSFGKAIASRDCELRLLSKGDLIKMISVDDLSPFDEFF